MDVQIVRLSGQKVSEHKVLSSIHFYTSTGPVLHTYITVTITHMLLRVCTNTLLG